MNPEDPSPRLLTRISRTLAYWLRHRPDAGGLTLDDQGYASVADLIRAAERAKLPLDEATLARIVAEDEKGRYSFSPDGKRLRANQGHSVTVDLGLEAVDPPEYLYHGTVGRHLASIHTSGLSRGKRHHVHLSADLSAAKRVGERFGSPVILWIRARDMQRAGHAFYLSDNGIWLADHVPPEFIVFPGQREPGPGPDERDPGQREPGPDRRS